MKSPRGVDGAPAGAADDAVDEREGPASTGASGADGHGVASTGEVGAAPAVDRLSVRAFRVPTDAPESDGTLAWDETGLVVVHLEGGGATGLGFAYTHPAAAGVIRSTLESTVRGMDALAPRAAWHAMVLAVRNVGRKGLVSSAIAAVDVALWDLAARLTGVPLATLLGRMRDAIPAYGSGGFTSYSDARLREQLAAWARAGMTMVKMKVARDPPSDPHRVASAREAIGDDVALFVDANGGYRRKEAMAWTRRFHEAWGVSWMEEPVSSDDLEGLHVLREHGPAGVDIAAGEYGWDLFTFRDMLAAGAVDTLQADLGRCGGYTEFLRVAALAAAHGVPLSAHTAPSLHAPVMCAVERGVHVEYFHDHARIEAMLFDGALSPDGGTLRPRRDAPGHGLTFKERDAEVYRVA